MDWLEYLNHLVESQGFAGAMALLLICVLIFVLTMYSKQMKGLTDAIVILTDKVSAPYLDSERSVELFRIIRRDCIWEKLSFIGDILEYNNIKLRREQIKKNVDREFKRVTTRHAEKLSHYKSVCGDMGKTMVSIVEWPVLLKSCYAVIFSDDEDKRKIADIHALLNEETDKFVKIIEDNGVRN